MRKTLAAFALTAVAASLPAHAAPSASDVLKANEAAIGTKPAGEPVLKTDYAYAGQGMTGKVKSLSDTQNGWWTDNFTVGPAGGANGFDGTYSWGKDPSGTITLQEGGDQRQLAVNEGYRRANLWWRADRGGAAIADDGEKTDAGATYDVLTVTPRDGKPFDAWFDARTHLVTQIVEASGPQTITTTFSDYRPVDGMKLAYKFVTDNGDVKYDQTLTLTSAAFLPAEDVSAYSAPKTAVNDFTIAGNGKETTFPFKLLNNHIYADVSVNGQGPFFFIFDSGGVNLVTPPTAQKLGLKSEGDMEGNGAGSGHMDVGLTKISSVRIGDATIKDQVFAVLPLNEISNVEGVDEQGMIGYETFRRFVTRVDYGAQTITLTKVADFDPTDAGAAIPISFNGNTIEAQATFDGVPGNFTIDTGSRASLILDAPFVAKNNLRAGAGKGVDAVTGWGVGGATTSYATRGKSLQIGPMTVANPIVEMATDKGGATVDSSIAGNIGAGILKRYIVTLDYEHSKMYLKPVTTEVADLDTFDRAGLWINRDASGFKIVDVTKGAPADAAGLKADDLIVAIDGKPATGLPLYDVRKSLRDEPAGTVVTFTVKRGSGTKDVPVMLRDLI